MRLVFALLLCLSAVACSSRPESPPTYPVQGTVVGAKDVLLEGGIVTLRGSDTDRTIQGTIGAAGAFTLKTLRRSELRDGAEAGTYTVEVIAPQSADQKIIPIVVKTKQVVIEPKENQVTIEVVRGRT
jgi:hypothetical protein